jgi:hypothetical protein
VKRPTGPPLEPPEPEWRVALRLDWEDRLEATEELVKLGQFPPESLEEARARMAWELDHPDESDVTIGDHEVTRREIWEREVEARGGARSPDRPGPRTLATIQQAHVDWLDAQALDGKVNRESPVWKWRLSLLPQRAADLVGALLARARQVRRSPRARERRPRRSGPPSRDGPDEPPDDPDDVDRARRGWSR